MRLTWRTNCIINRIQKETSIDILCGEIP